MEAHDLLTQTRDRLKELEEDWDNEYERAQAWFRDRCGIEDPDELLKMLDEDLPVFLSGMIAGTILAEEGAYGL